MNTMSHIHTHQNRPKTALIQVGHLQITVELDGGVRVGDEQWTHKLSKQIAAGLESAFETQPPRGAV